jgi:hypothetical protein
LADRTSIPTDIDCFGHNDLGPYNMAFDGTDVAAITDRAFVAVVGICLTRRIDSFRYLRRVRPMRSAGIRFRARPPGSDSSALPTT